MKTKKAFNVVEALLLAVVAPIFAIVFFIPWVCGAKFYVKKGTKTVGYIRRFKYIKAE